MPRFFYLQRFQPSGVGIPKLRLSLATFSDLSPTFSDILLGGLNERFFDEKSPDKEMNVRTSAPFKLTVVYILDKLKHTCCHYNHGGGFFIYKEAREK